MNSLAPDIPLIDYNFIVILLSSYAGGMEIYATDEFADWYRTLDQRDGDAVIRCIDMLELDGVNLGYPFSSAIKNASFALRELRLRSGGRPFRVFYAFDPGRDIVLLIGGDKSGDKRFYDKMIRRSEILWNAYLIERGFEDGP